MEKEKVNDGATKIEHYSNGTSFWTRLAKERRTFLPVSWAPIVHRHNYKHRQGVIYHCCCCWCTVETGSNLNASFASPSSSLPPNWWLIGCLGGGGEREEGRAEEKGKRERWRRLITSPVLNEQHYLSSVELLESLFPLLLWRPSWLIEDAHCSAAEKEWARLCSRLANCRLMVAIRRLLLPFRFGKKKHQIG